MSITEWKAKKGSFSRKLEKWGSFIASEEKI